MPRHFLRDDDLAPAGTRQQAQEALPWPLVRAA